MRVGIVKVTDFLNPLTENVDFARHRYETGSPPPIAWHSFAAATDGFVHIYDPNNNNDIIYDCDMSIVVIDKWITELDNVVKKIQSRKIPIVFSFHEGWQTTQRMAALSKNMKYFTTIRKIAANNNIKAWINPMPKNISRLFEIYSSTLDPQFKVYDIPSCWPMRMSESFMVPINERNGIIVGNSDWSNFASRNTFLSFIICAKLSNDTNQKVTIILPEQQIEVTGFREIYNAWFTKTPLNIITRKLSYLEWLKLLSCHKVSINLDLSLSQGQPVGDCALVNIPSIGGNSTIQTLVYPNLASDTTDFSEVYHLAKNLLTNDALYEKTCIESNIIANKEISFEAVNKKLLDMYNEIKEQ